MNIKLGIKKKRIPEFIKTMVMYASLVGWSKKQQPIAQVAKGATAACLGITI